MCQVRSQPDLYQPDVEIEEVASFLHDKSLVHIFLEKHFLHWLEALGLMGKSHECVSTVSQLEEHTISKALMILFLSVFN